MATSHNHSARDVPAQDLPVPERRLRAVHADGPVAAPVRDGLGPAAREAHGHVVHVGLQMDDSAKRGWGEAGVCAGRCSGMGSGGSAARLASAERLVRFGGGVVSPIL
ncbi:hypothetical protein VP1G_11284 [Cytospora mali]|uniref:Uncharacterized protein n=1 Tax=Cytospora mali TaxID=578113 RepID=A0A194VCV7_CYTMA|nr:hypothetical protein VP1G_11284 [Valsa mali var. pyri (nom. inval.)]